MKRWITCATAFCLSLTLVLPVSLRAEIYKWVDENGKTRFSDVKPGKEQVEVIKTRNHRGDWRSFDIKINDYSQQLTAEERVKVAQGVNRVYWFYDRVLYFDMYKTVPVHATLLPDKKRYYEYLHAKRGKPAPSSLGMYLGQENEIVTYLHKKRASVFRTINHEVSHAIIDTVTPFTPSWLNEGLAEQMEFFVERNGSKRVYANRNHFKRVKARAKSGSLQPLQDFLSMNSRAWVRQNRNENYEFQEYTGVFVYFLLNSPQGRNLLTRLIHNYERGSRKFASAVIDENYTGGVSMLEVHWQSWLRGEGSRYVEF